MAAGHTIMLNGAPHPVAGPQTVAALLEALGLAGRPVVVELDGRAISPSAHLTTEVKPGAKVELVTLAAGG